MKYLPIWIVLACQLLSATHVDGAAAPGKIILGYAAPGARALPFWTAQELGLFAKYGVDVEPVFIRGAPILVAGLASGDIHVGSTGGSATMAAVAGGQDLKISRLFPAGIPLILSASLPSNGPKTCAASALALPASAAPPGWRCCSGSSITVSMCSAIKCSCKSLGSRR